MASSYALPPNGATANGHGHTRGHGHHHSYSGGSSIYLSPDKGPSSSFSSPNGHSHKKALFNSGLYVHAEASRETSPLPSPPNNQIPNPFDASEGAFRHNASVHSHQHHTHAHSRTHSVSPMRRPRGDSDLGRAPDGKIRSHVVDNKDTAGKSGPLASLAGALTSVLIPLPFLFASAAYSFTHGHSAQEEVFPPFPAYARPLPAYTRLQHGGPGEGVLLADHKPAHSVGIIQTCALTSATLLLVGALSKIRSSERMLDRRKTLGNFTAHAHQLLSASSVRTALLRIFGLGLPFYACMQIGGMRVGLVFLILIASELTFGNVALIQSLGEWKATLSSRKGSIAVLMLCLLSDFSGWTFHANLANIVLGYLTISVSTLALPSVLPPSNQLASKTSTSGTKPWSTLSPVSPLIGSVADANITLMAGLTLSIVTIAMSFIWSATLLGSMSTLILSTLSVLSMACTILFSQPHTLQSRSKAELGLGCFITASCAFLYSPDLWPGTICNGALSALSFLGVLYDTNKSAARRDTYDHDHDHAHNTHKHHHHDHSDGGYSFLTNFLISRCEPGSLFYSILAEKDSRRIAYFTTLNFGFMFIQGVYGYLSGSLGLLSDTVHMFFDCLGLVVGLGAAVASKWPDSADKPYGWGKLNTLAGFGNGVFLMLVSVEFVWEAIEGILEAKELRHVKELLVVSVLGFLVNMVGLFAFGHAHAGHDHGHSHSHSHDHSHSHSHGHSHDHDHDHSHSNSHVDSHSHGHSHAGHTHEHGLLCEDSHKVKSSTAHAHEHNENMEGIFLHVAADAGGSLAVILSTALTLWKPWYLWDPLATIIIAVLIFAMAVPLVISSGQKLLLVIPDQVEYNIKNALQDVGEMRGVVGYTLPRFWLDDHDDAGDGHGHHHHGHDDGGAASKKKILGVIHIIAAQAADLEDVRERVEEFLQERNMDVVIHVERETDVGCSCRDSPKIS
ncbi:Hypothetical protein R9X50_00341000 [Acrodontium crateriforme]|uniref:Zinc transporter n=1 Tax=Acrodontium crateriforme TaxID=150365 RepID=A0AAQ3M3A3_9PEZI|nr:Hypothetical protein R9X50_00341000 [Acrodontium crateriforme]